MAATQQHKVDNQPLAFTIIIIIIIINWYFIAVPRSAFFKKTTILRSS